MDKSKYKDILSRASKLNDEIRDAIMEILDNQHGLSFKYCYTILSTNDLSYDIKGARTRYEFKQNCYVYIFYTTNGDELELDEIMETCLRDVLDVLCVSLKW